MTFKEAMKEIESHEFAARLNVASDLRTFLRAAQGQEAIHILLRELDSLEGRQQLLSRVLELSQRQIDVRYENQWDTALAIYVWLFSLKDSVLAQAAAEAARHAPQCWWATKVSRHILLESPTRSDAKEEIFFPVPSKVIQTSDSGETVLYTNLLFAGVKGPIVKADVGNCLDLSAPNKWSPQQFSYEILPQNNNSNTSEERLTL